MKVTYISPYDIHITDHSIKDTRGDIIGTFNDGDGELFYQSTNVEGLYSYGYKQLKDSYDHSAGYIWSSRPSCINKAFGTKLVGCVFNGAQYAVDAEVALPMVEEFYGKKCYIKMTENDTTDVSYKIVPVEED